MDFDVVEAFFGEGHIEPGVEAKHGIVFTAGDLLAGGVVDADDGVDGGAGAAGIDFEDAAFTGFDLQAVEVAFGALQGAVERERRRGKSLGFFEGIVLVGGGSGAAFFFGQLGEGPDVEEEDIGEAVGGLDAEG